MEPVAVRPVAVKFCGLVRAEDAALAGALGARYVGAIFAGGPRLLDAPRARTVFDAAAAGARDARNDAPRAVGVMGTQPVDEIARVAEAAALDVVQLHADPDATTVARVRAATGRAVWAVVRVDGVALPPHVASLCDAADAVLLDPKVAGALGGTGVALDWARLADALAPLRGRGPLVLAGGLTPDNVARAARLLAPDVVDVSSGVEASPGVKDAARMRAFVAAVRYPQGPAGVAAADAPTP